MRQLVSGAGARDVGAGDRRVPLVADDADNMTMAIERCLRDPAILGEFLRNPRSIQVGVISQRRAVTVGFPTPPGQTITLVGAAHTMTAAAKQAKAGSADSGATSHQHRFD